MKKALPYIIAVAALISLGFVLGRFTMREKVVRVELKPNVDSIAAVLLAGKVDSVTHAELQRLYSGLLEWSKHLPAGIDTIFTDTGRVERAQAPFDTTLNTAWVTVAEGDTGRLEGETRVRFNIAYIGPPYRSFVLSDLHIDYPALTIPVKTTDPTIVMPSADLFAVRILGAVSHGSPGLGVGLNVGPVEIGSTYHADKDWTFIAGWRLW